MNEVNIQSVDLGHELRQGFQLRLDPQPVIVRDSVADLLLHPRQLMTRNRRTG
jgi:hypothetical protein